VVVELRAGEGGEDSKLFVHDLFAAYVKYGNSHNLESEILESSKGSITAKFCGKGAGKAFQYEGGKHCIQRVPPTEKRGRRQTSQISVAVLPMPPKRERSLIPESEIDIKFSVGSGPGGQHKNRTESAVTMVHRPTKIKVYLDGGRCQHSNRADALEILSAKVNQHRNAQKAAERSAERKRQVDGGGRGNKIRTYNYIKSRAVDHRNGKKTKNVQAVIEKGRFDLLID